MVGRPSPQNPLINRLTSPPDSLTSKCRRSRHTISNTIRDGTQSVCENTQSVQLGDHRVVGDLAELCREREAAIIFMDDLKSRLANRVQLTSDGHKAYLEAVEGAFGADVDYAQLVKLYGESPDAEKRYSPAVCIGAHKNPIEGNPDPKYISTSFAERQNLNVRMHTRRFTRLTNAFSKKVENHAHSVALFAMYYNFVRIHKTLRTTPAMAAKVTKRLWEIGDIVDVLEAWENTT
jgi:3-methyladenine DNA glycosylase/8-oxoguanine DNA glycosylase